VDKWLWNPCLLGGGDDYELLFTAPPNARDSIDLLSQRLSLPLTRIGRMWPLQTPCDASTILANPVQLLNDTNQPIDLSGFCPGFDHFA